MSEDLPPSYPSAIDGDPSRPNRSRALEHLSGLTLNDYRVPDSILSKDRQTLTVYSKTLCNDPIALSTFLTKQTKLPPRPIVHVVSQSDGEENNVIHYDIKIDMIRHVVSNDLSRQWSYVQSTTTKAPSNDAKKSTITSGDDILKESIQTFCRNNSQTKTYVFKKVITNWDKEYISARIRHLCSSINPSAEIKITFPIEHSTVIINSWARPAGFLSSVSSFFSSSFRKEFHPVTVIWPFASSSRLGDVNARNGRRECILQSEDEWWEEWEGAIKSAMKSNRRGWVSWEDQLDCVMEGQ